MSALTILIFVIIIALAFEYINGFHDTANSIATVISTKVLSPKVAVIYGAILNFAGAFAGTHVAKTIGKGIVATENVTQIVIICALLGAIIWNLITWWFGIPSSSSHALIGGLIGAAIVNAGISVVNTKGVIEKILIPMFMSPVVGFAVGFLFMIIILWIVRKAAPERVNKYFKKLQILSAGFMAFSHGSNDAQKTMGIMTLALFSFSPVLVGPDFGIPIWVTAACAITMAIGTYAGGWKIIHTMGNKVFKMKPIHGFATELSSSSIILAASYFGIPVSTTHVKSTSIMGVGSSQRLSAVKWGLVGNIVVAWVFTIPSCMIISGAIFYLIRVIAHI